MVETTGNKKYATDEEVFGSSSKNPTYASDEEVFGQPKRTVLGTVADAGVSLAKGVVGTGEAAAGLASLATGGLAGKGLDAIGYDPTKTQEILSDMYSPAQKAANKRIDSAKGFVDTAKAYIQNPSTIANALVETAPMMLAGGAAGRVAMKGLQAAAPVISRVAPTVASKIPGLPGFAAGAAGEGLVATGSAAEQIRQASPDKNLTTKGAVAAVGSGIGTTIFGAVGGRLAQKLGFVDPDTYFAAGVSDTIKKEAKKKGLDVATAIARRIVGGGISEGVFEEMPQSIQETIWQNVALDRPIMEGVPESAAQGAIVGMAMGGAANLLPEQRQAITQDQLGQPGQPPQQEQPPPPASPPEEFKMGLDAVVDPDLRSNLGLGPIFSDTTGPIINQPAADGILRSAAGTRFDNPMQTDQTGEEILTGLAAAESLKYRQAANSQGQRKAFPGQEYSQAAPPTEIDDYQPQLPVDQARSAAGTAYSTPTNEDIQTGIQRRASENYRQVANTKQQRQQFPGQTYSQAQPPQADNELDYYPDAPVSPLRKTAPGTQYAAPTEEDIAVAEQQQASLTYNQQRNNQGRKAWARPTNQAGMVTPAERKLTPGQQRLKDARDKFNESYNAAGTIPAVDYISDKEAADFGAKARDKQQWKQQIDANKAYRKQSVEDEILVNDRDIPVEVKRQAEKEADQIINEDPIYQHLAEAKRRGGLNLESFKSGYDATSVAQITRRYPAIFSRIGKVKPDEFATDMGYGSLDEMIQRFAGAKTKTELRAQLTRQKLDEWKNAETAQREDQARAKAKANDQGMADEFADEPWSAAYSRPENTQNENNDYALNNVAGFTENPDANEDDGKGTVLYSKSEGKKPLSKLLGKWQDKFANLSVADRANGDINVSSIVVAKDKRGSGTGSKFMTEMTTMADKTGRRITLSPERPGDNSGTTSRGRLIKFYKRFGFVENKGKNRDYSISESMYRLPNTSTNTAKMSEDTQPATTTATLDELAPDQRLAVDLLQKSGKLEIVTNDEALDALKAAAMNIDDARKSADGSRIEGFYLPNGKTYLVAENIAKGQLWSKAVHEVGVHAGKALQTNQAFKNLLKSIESRMDEHSGTGEALRTAKKMVPKDTAPENVTEEILAYAVANHPKIGIVRQFIALVKNVMVKMGINPKIFTAADLTALAESALHREAWSGVAKAAYRQGSKPNINGTFFSKKIKQAIGSAGTSLNQVSALFKMGLMKPGTVNVDIGGGKYDKVTEYLAGIGVKNLVYDPFNRSKDFNSAVVDELSTGPVDTATVNSVLNVIAERDVRMDVVRQAAKAIKRDGTAYFLIHQGDADGNSRVTKRKDDPIQSSWQNHQKAEWYIDDVKSWFGNVIRKGTMLVATDPKVSWSPDAWLDDGKAEGLPPNADARFSVSNNLGKWFGKSKVTNNQGNPATVHHGSPTFGRDNNSWEFDPNRATGKTRSPGRGLGTFFTTDRNESLGYAGPSGAVQAIHLKVENPLEIYSFQIPNFQNTDEAKAYRKRKELAGHDGIHIKDLDHWVIFDAGQAKSADKNSGEFNPATADIRFSRSAAGERAFAEDTREAMGTFTEKIADKPDMPFIAKLLSAPEYYFRTFPATWKMFQAQLNRHKQKFELENQVLGDFVPVMEKASKEDTENYKKANDYLLDTDKTGKAFRIKHRELIKVVDGNGSIIGLVDTPLEASRLMNDHAGKNNMMLQDYRQVPVEEWTVIGNDGKPLSTHETEKAAQDAMGAAEQKYLAGQGFSPQAMALVARFREMTNAVFDLMVKDMRVIRDEIRAAELTEPTFDLLDEERRYGVKMNGKIVASFETEADAKAAAMARFKAAEAKFKTTKAVVDKPTMPEVVRRPDADITKTITLSEAIARMSDLRGQYFPRQREPGKIILRATKGDSKIMEKFDLYLMDKKAVDQDTGEQRPRPASNWLRRQFNRATGFIPFSDTLEKRARQLRSQNYDIKVDKDTSVPESVFDATKIFSTMEALLTKSAEKANAAAGEEADLAVSQEVSNLITTSLADIFKARGYLSSRLRRQEDYWEGFETDMLLAGTQYARGIASGIAKRDAAKAMISALTGRDETWQQFKERTGGEGKWEEYAAIVNANRLDPGTQPVLHGEAMSWLKEVLRNDEQIDRILGTLKGLAVIKFLGFRVSSAAVNITNMVMAVPATISSQTGGKISSALRSITFAATQYGKYRSGRGEITDDDRSIFLEISNNGWDQAQFNYENASVLMSKLGRGWNRFGEYAMMMFGAVEKVNRATTIFAAYKEIRANTALTHDEAMLKAKDISDQAHGIYGKASLPAWARGAANPLKLSFTFHKFSQNYALNMMRMGMKGDYKQAAYMIISPAIMGGVGSTLLTPVIAALAKSLGVGGDDPEEEFYDWIAETFGDDSVARHGIPGMLGINLKGSIEMNNPLPKTPEELGGAPWSVISDTAKGFKYLAKGEGMKGMESLLPTAFGSAVKAWREGTEGITTGSYGQVFYGDEALKASTGEQFVRALSFNPSRISGIREKQWHEKQVAAKYAKRKAEITEKLKRYYLFNSGDYDELMKEFDHYNELVIGSGRNDIPRLTARGIQQAVRQARKPNKTERLRE